MISKTMNFGYYFCVTFWQSVCSFFVVFKQGIEMYRHTAYGPECFALDPDEVIGDMDAEELCNALNKAMYLHPEDPETMYPDWFVELAREGIYLAGVKAINSDVTGECVVKFNEKVISFDHDHWVPAQMAQ